MMILWDVGGSMDKFTNAVEFCERGVREQLLKVARQLHKYFKEDAPVAKRCAKYAKEWLANATGSRPRTGAPDAGVGVLLQRKQELDDLKTAEAVAGGAGASARPAKKRRSTARAASNRSPRKREDRSSRQRSASSAAASVDAGADSEDSQYEAKVNSGVYTASHSGGSDTTHRSASRQPRARTTSVPFEAHEVLSDSGTEEDESDDAHGKAGVRRRLQAKRPRRGSAGASC